MARFNTQTVNKTKTVNRAGGKAYKKSTKLELASILLTSFVQDQFYRTKEETMEQLCDAVDRLKPSERMFAGQAGVYARNEWGMRSITHVLASHIGKNVKGVEWTRPFFYNVARRVDDMTEVVALYLSKYGKPLPNSMKDGFAKAFDKFDAYQLAKYRGKGKDVSLVDVVNLVRPKPTEKNKEALKQLIDGNLRSSGTWESEQTRAGKEATSDADKAEKKAENWQKLVAERKIGYFALLRNLRNIATQASDEVLEEALFMLRDPGLIKKSLVLPFRYWTAMEEMGSRRSTGLSSTQYDKITASLNDAMELALDNVPTLPGKTVVVLDESGSMSRSRGGTPPIRHGAIFTATILRKNPGAELILFAGTARKVRLKKIDSLATMANHLVEGATHGGTNLSNAFHLMNKEDMDADRIIILTDEQSWVDYRYGGRGGSSAYNDYAKKLGKRPLVYSWDLSGYGDMQFPEQSVCALAGFSEKAFDVIKLLETDKQALVHEIEKIKLV